MIYVDDLPFMSAEPSTEGGEILASLLEHPMMIASSNLLKATPVKKVSFSEESPLAKCLYVFQREYAAVDPSLVEFVGTDEATTCVGLVIRNQNTKRTSICHMDFVDVVDMGLTQMLSFVVDVDVDANLDVHLIGSFDDGPHDLAKGGNGSGSYATSGYSLPLCSKIVAALQSRKERFQLKTLCVLSLNTKSDIAGNATPIVSGFLVMKH